MEKLELWFPNYQNNPGILSKVLRQEVQELLENFSVTIDKSYFEGFERFCMEVTFDDPSYKEYITSLLERRYGSFNTTSELEVSQELTGRLISPGKVGFGVFVDIGVRQNGSSQDALLPLFHLRDDLEMDLSLREIVSRYGLINSLPIKVEISSISEEDTSKVNLKLAGEEIDKFNMWEEGNERLIITRTLQSKVEKAVKTLGIDTYIEGTEQIDPLTTVVICKRRTSASGLLPKLGTKLPGSPIGIFKPYTT